VARLPRILPHRPTPAGPRYFFSADVQFSSSTSDGGGNRKFNGPFPFRRRHEPARPMDAPMMDWGLLAAKVGEPSSAPESRPLGGCGAREGSGAA
jgi:hypothetical protein